MKKQKPRRKELDFTADMGFIRKHDQPKGQITDINEYRGRKAAAARDEAHNPSPDYRVKDVHPLEAHYQSQVDLPKLGMKRPGIASRFTTMSMRTMDSLGKKMGVISEDESLYQDVPLKKGRFKSTKKKG